MLIFNFTLYFLLFFPFFNDMGWFFFFFIVQEGQDFSSSHQEQYLFLSVKQYFHL